MCYVFFLQLHSLVDPVSAMGKWYAWSRLKHVTGRFLCVYAGKDAFVSKDKIPRTPLSKPMYQMRGKNIPVDCMIHTLLL